MNYEINEKTFALIPSGDKKCKVLEDKHSYNINRSSFKVIEHSCEYFGVSYKSRLTGSTKLLNTRYKSPIVIEDISRLVFFPVTSPSKKDTMWISYNNVLEYYQSNYDKKHTIVRFKNGYKLDVPISYYSFNNQFLKAARLNSVLSDRIIRKN